MKKEKYISTETNSNFWECVCKENYIHLKDQNNTTCEVCNTHQDDEDMPDARQEEILQSLIGKKVNIHYKYMPPQEHFVIVLKHIDRSRTEEPDSDILS